MIEIIDKGFGYFQTGLGWLRDILTKLAEILPWSEQLTLMILFLAVSFYAGYLICKRFVTNPLSLSYVWWYALISLLIFIILNYL